MDELAELPELPDIPDIVTDEVRDAAEAGARKGAQPRRGGGLIAVISSILGAAIAIFAIQNLDSAEVDFLAWTIELPLAATIGIAFVVGALISSLMGWGRRRRKAKARG